ncbi:MAG: Sec-independent protein translocase protein TatA [bacterium]|nr:Sec-independent protein translocase protein TatA [bacterium]MCK6560772.1 twin-arginine translocase TatA/TatE family subunit [bacterium]NUM64507.1 twin-arginine translocase TatA/TatE family subunit [candidate division KSB1 bacterium]
MPGPQELIVILIIVLVLFGAKKLPELARGLGQGIREFKKAASSSDEQDKIEPPKQQSQANQPN